MNLTTGGGTQYQMPSSQLLSIWMGQDQAT